MAAGTADQSQSERGEDKDAAPCGNRKEKCVQTEASVTTTRFSLAFLITLNMLTPHALETCLPNLLLQQLP